jgi:deferrochelatase/peroxidase EfeB
MGRWRSGAPLVLSPNKDDPILAADPQRNNDFNYKEMDPQGYAVPLGSHARRMNPRDTAGERGDEAHALSVARPPVWGRLGSTGRYSGDSPSIWR